MNLSPRILKTSAVLLSGASIGGAVGYAASASGASTSHGAKTNHSASAHSAKAARRQAGRLSRAVSLTAVVPSGHGHFATLSIERGTLTSVSGQTLTLREGTVRADYKTVTVTLPSTAVVRLSGAPSSLTALSPGERVAIVQGPRKTTVVARPPRSAKKSKSAAASTPSQAPAAS